MSTLDEHNDVLAEYGELITRLNATGKWWMIGKGQAKPGEKMWGCLIQEPKVDGKTLALTEGHELLTTVWSALGQLPKKAPETD